MFDIKERIGFIVESTLKRILREEFEEEDLTPFEEYENGYPNDDFDVSDMTPEKLAKWCRSVGDFLYVFEGLRGLRIMAANVDSIVYDIVSDLYNCDRIEPTHEVDYLFRSRERDFLNQFVCIFKVIGTKDGDYYVVYQQDRFGSPMELDESRKLINEAFKSNELRAWFKQHGGVKRLYTEPKFKNLKDKRVYQDGLGDVTDDAIVYLEEFYDIKKPLPKKGEEDEQEYETITAFQQASKKQFDLKTPNPYTRQRSDWDMKAYFTIYKANDGTCLLVGIDRTKMDIGTTWGGEATKKTADRVMRNGWNMKTRSNRYVDDSDKYYYSDKGRYFGINDSDIFKGYMEHNDEIRNNMSDDKWKEYQNKRVERIRNKKRNAVSEAINKIVSENIFNDQWEREIEIFLDGLENGQAIVDNGYVAVEWGNDETDPRYIYYKEGEDHLTDDHFSQQHSRRLYWDEISKIRDYAKRIYGVDIYIPDDEYYEEVYDEEQ